MTVRQPLQPTPVVQKQQQQQHVKSPPPAQQQQQHSTTIVRSLSRSSSISADPNPVSRLTAQRKMSIESTKMHYPRRRDSVSSTTTEHRQTNKKLFPESGYDSSSSSESIHCLRRTTPE